MVKNAFRVFENEAVGRIFTPDNISYEKILIEHISPFHGRAVAIKIIDYNWITVKGGGWNYGGPQVYKSVKDSELIFGLYSSDSAERELRVSRELEKISDKFPKVLYYKKLADYQLPKEFNCIINAKYSNGQAVKPCLIYTQVKCPYRVADLMYISQTKRHRIIESNCNFWHIPIKDFTNRFIEVLAEHIAIMHKNGFINDTLDYGNVTLLAEIIDYEWVTAPNIKLFDGTYGLKISDERKEKEILYGAEVCLQLKALLQQKYNLFEIYKIFARSYCKINPDFINNCINIQKILNGEKIIL